jgi:hypothetical protein
LYGSNLNKTPNNQSGTGIIGKEFLHRYITIENLTII